MNNERTSYFKRGLVMLMAFIMVFTYMPGGTWGPDTAWADELDATGSGAVETETNVSDDKQGEEENSLLALANNVENGKIQLTLSGMHDAQVASLKLYTYSGSTKGETDLLAGVEQAESAYTISLEEGTYWVEGYDADGSYNGGMSITVDESHKEFKIERIYQISVSPSTWVAGEDYNLNVEVMPEGNGEPREVELGTTINGKGMAWEKTYSTCIFAVGDTVEATVTPLGDNALRYNPAMTSTTPTGNVSLSITCKEFVTVNFTAPANSTITVGTLTKYFIFSYKDAETSDVSKGTATYKLDKGTTYFYRVQNPSGVTYWNYSSWSAAGDVNISEDDLYIGNTEFEKDTIYRFEKNAYDRADIYLNINSQGYKNMKVGETFELNSFRNWFAIEGFMNSKVALPDMHYEVIDENGNSSDVVTITPDEKNSNVATMKASKEGTAIVLVTYDAMTDAAGMSTAASKQFSAIWPECTGVFVVTVGKDGTGIQTNMQLDRMDEDITKEEKKTLDAEHDILFYLGDEGAKYSFKPEEGCAVTVARSTVKDKMTFSGFTTSGVTTSEDGTVTITGLTTGRHIVKVEKNGVANYQVITARGVSYKLVDEDGKELTEGAKAALKAGDTIYLQFSNLVSPKEKLSGAYNFNFSLYYEGEDGTYFKSNPGGNFGVYDFSGNPARQKIAITIPKYWDGSSYTLTGAIKQGGFAGVPTHRGITYAAGTDPGFNAPSVSGILSRLPEVTLNLVATEFISGKLTFKGSDGSSIARSGLTITMKDSGGNVVEVKEDGTFKALAEEYSYEITGQGTEYTTGSIAVADKGENEFEITLPVTSDTAWDGTTMTEPAKDGRDVYQIGTGAQLAWFVNQSKTENVSGVLTSDIDLAKYPWIAIQSSKKVQLDGSGHEISGLNATKGLFSQIGGGSHIQNLTLYGNSTEGGSVTGYASGSGTVIENCFSYVTINGTGQSVGGIAGYAYTATIKNCANFGNVAGSKYVGGIVGSFVSNGNAVTGCYSEGKVTATASEAGGIFGSSGYEIAVSNCYNTGSVAVTGTNGIAGGIGGKVKGSTHWSTGEVLAKMSVTNCYTTGTMSAFGSVDSASADISKCYSLKADDEYAKTLTEDADLNTDAFGVTCEGYPALKWQQNVAFHEAGEAGIVTAPTCTEKGYTTYTCTKCKKSYKSMYTEALGHTPDTSKEKAYPAYKETVCSICKETYKVWNDTRLQYVVLPDAGVTTVTMSDSGDYPWTWNKDKARFESSNTNKGNTTSKTEMTFVLSEARYLSFEYGVSSEKDYDKATISLINGETVTKIADGISETAAGSYSDKLEAGTYTLVMEYVKDSAGNSSDDRAYITNVKITKKSEGGNVSPAPESKPSVTFRLIGAEKATQDVDLGTSKYLPNYVTWISTKTYTLEELGDEATVGTVFKKALDAKGLKYEGYENNYISSITSPSGYILSEMTNGPKSGWMYTVNGSHPDKGLLEYKVKDGDVIIWHYVNDYAYEVQDWFESKDYPALGDATTWNGWLRAADKEGSAGGGSSAVSEVKDVTTNTKTGTVTAPTQTKVTEKTNADGTREKTIAVTVSAANQTEIIKQAADKKSAEIVLEVASTATNGAQNVQLQLDVSFVKNVSEKTDAALTVNTENGTVSLDQSTIKTVLDEAKGTTITLDVNSVASPTDVQKKAAGESGQILSLTVKSGDKTISDFKTGKVTVTVAISAALQNKRVAAIYIAEDGKIEQMPGRSREAYGKKCYEFTTSHFSDFALVDANELGLETEEEIDAAALVAKLTPVARSAKTAKGCIKVQANLDKNDKAIISELQDAGYTVKYRFYRSTKKSASYKSALTKKTTTYTNTSGKKGTKYYYKVQVRVYDDSGKLVAKTALKQCKYACRTWK